MNMHVFIRWTGDHDAAPDRHEATPPVPPPPPSAPKKINLQLEIFPHMSAPTMSTVKPLDPAKVAFIEAAIAHGVLLFGTFTLKSGR